MNPRSAEASNDGYQWNQRGMAIIFKKAFSLKMRRSKVIWRPLLTVSVPGDIEAPLQGRVQGG